MLLCILIVFSCIPCKDISLIQSLVDVERSCALPKNRQKMWTCPIPPPRSRLPRDLLQIHQDCSLDELTDPQYFALNTGDSIRAAQIFFWLRKQKHPQARELALLALKERIIPENATIPILSVSKAPKLMTWEQITLISEEVNEVGSWGTYPYWHRTESNENTISLSGDTPVKYVRYAMASRKDQQSPLQIVVLDEFLTTVTLHPPTSTHPEIITQSEQGWYPKTERDQLRLDISDEEPISVVLDVIAKHPTKTVEITMEHLPCTDSFPNMTCIPGSTTQQTIYIDTHPIDDFASCVQAHVCQASQGTWASAVEQCRFRGKSLPTSSQSYPFANEQWTENRTPYHHLQQTTSERELPSHTKLTSSIQCVQYHPPNTLPISYPKQPIDTPEFQKRIQQLLQQENIPLDALDNRSWKYQLSSIDAQNQSIPYYTQLNGAYLGTADISTLGHIANARPEWAFVVGNHNLELQRLVMLASLIAQAESIDDFLAILSQKQRVHDILSPMAQRNPKANLLALWDQESSVLQISIQKMRTIPLYKQSWVTEEEDFLFLKQQILQQRVVILSGGWDGKKTIPSIAQVLTELSMPVHMLYLGNWDAEKQERDEQRTAKNIQSLPMTSHTRIFVQSFDGIRIIDGILFQERENQNTPVWWDIKKGNYPKVQVAGRIPISVDLTTLDSHWDQP